MLSTKRYDLEGFVQYARSLRESQAFHSRETAQTQWVTEVCTTLRRYSITTSDQARETLQQLQVVWAQFEASLSDGQQFVEKQTPIKAQGLQENISVQIITPSFRSLKLLYFVLGFGGTTGPAADDC